jgi:nucleoid-associated protein YgaU
MTLKSSLKSIKLNESTISLALGVIVIGVVGILVVNYFVGKKEGQTIPAVNVENLSLPTIHVVSEGESLWEISERYYSSGYNWVDIAKENDLANASTIEKGQELIIPRIPETESKVALTPETITPSSEVARESENGQITHQVKKGENLWKIAEKYYTSGYNWVDIAKANDLPDASLIEAGQELVIPDVSAVETKPVANKTTLTAISGEAYTVEKGDNLWAIAIRAYGDGYKWVEIAQENSLSNPNLIHSGNTLSIPR